MIRRPPRLTRTDTLFPYPTLFRSVPVTGRNCQPALVVDGDRGLALEHNNPAHSCPSSGGLQHRKTTNLPVSPRVATLWAAHRVVNSFTRNFRSEEPTSELQSLMRLSYAVFCLKKKK